MVWTYHDVKKLREKRGKDKEITTSEIRALEKYVSHKKEVAHLGNDWSEKQLLRAQELLHEVQKETKQIEVQQ